MPITALSVNFDCTLITIACKSMLRTYSLPTYKLTDYAEMPAFNIIHLSYSHDSKLLLATFNTWRVIICSFNHNFESLLSLAIWNERNII